MLDIIICDESREDAQLLAAMIKKALAELEIVAKLQFVQPDRLGDCQFQDGQPCAVFSELVFAKSGLDGIQLAERLRKQNFELALVFVSSHLEFMPSILRGNIIPSAFLKKPLRYADVSEISGNISKTFDDLYSDRFFILNMSAEVCRLPYSQLLYFEALQKKINLHTISRRYTFYSTLSSLESELSGKGFIRCHNSFIINKDKVSKVSFSDMLVTMENDAVLPISRSFKQGMKDAFAGARILEQP